MAIESKFYDGPNTEIDRAVSAVSGSISLYGVAGANDLMLTPHPSTPYAVNIGTGNMWGHKVWDRVTSTEVVQCEAPAQGATRWDLIAAHRDWQPLDGGPTSLIDIQGSTSKAIPATRENQPGTVDDQPLWLVQWRGGETQPIATVDLRCWGANGGLVAADDLARTYLNVPGARVHIGDTEHRFVRGSNGVFEWRYYQSAGGQIVVPIANGGNLGSVQVSFPHAFPSPPSVTLTKSTTSGPASSLRKLETVVKNITTTGFTAYVETNDGTGVGAAFNVDCQYTAIQSN